jgi:acyl carrier protein
MENVFALNWGAVNQSKKREFESLPEFRGLSEEHLKNRMTDEETKAAFLKILLSGSKWPRVVVSTIDLNTVLKEWNNVSTKRSLTREVQVPLKKRDSIEVIKNNNFISPVDLFEEKISYYLSEILGIDKVSMEDNFFDLGGHSLSAIRLNEKIKKDFGISLHAMTIYEYPIVKEMAQFIREKVQSKQSVS